MSRTEASVVETAKRLRVPLAWFVLACAALQIVVAVARWVLYGRDTGDWAGSARALAASTMALPVLLLVVALVTACAYVRPRVESTHAMARSGGLLAGAAGLLSLAMLLFGLVKGTSPGIFFVLLDLLGGMIDIALKLGAALFLLRLAASRVPGEIQGGGASRQTEEGPVTAELPAPSWGADQARGSVWTRAGDAATGAAPSSWQPRPDAPRGGWQPAAPQHHGSSEAEPSTSVAGEPDVLTASGTQRPAPRWDALPPRER